MTMIGNYDIKNPKLITSILSPHLYIPVPLWYAKHHKELFPMCLMKDSLHVHVEFEKGSELIEENPDEDFNIKILLVPNIASGDVKLDITVEYPNTDKYADYSYEGDYTSSVSRRTHRSLRHPNRDRIKDNKINQYGRVRRTKRDENRRRSGFTES